MATAATNILEEAREEAPLSRRLLGTPVPGAAELWAGASAAAVSLELGELGEPEPEPELFKTRAISSGMEKGTVEAVLRSMLPSSFKTSGLAAKKLRV